MRTSGNHSAYGSGKFFVILLILALGITLGSCKDKNEADADKGEIAQTKDTTERQRMKKEPFTNSVGMKFVYLPPGTFMMGSPQDEKRRVSGDRETLHKVTLTKGFFMQTTEVTEKQWKAVMGTDPDKIRGDDYPVRMVAWESAQEFVRKLNRKEGGSQYRLPTEAEWEYACRAGSSTRFCFGDDEKQLAEYAWYEGRPGNMLSPVGQLKPNAWGLYDMHGNVAEWCQDWFDNFTGDDVTDPAGPATGTKRVLRGCSCNSSYFICRSAFRKPQATRAATIGFRLAKSAE